MVVLGLIGSLNGVEASKKKKDIKPKTLCPVDEIACPIIGSTCVRTPLHIDSTVLQLTPRFCAACRTYDEAVEHHFKLKGEVTGVMAGYGGCESSRGNAKGFIQNHHRLTLEIAPADECINTSEALDSCGGCASTGEGHDCTRIRGSVGVGCEAGKCVVFSCKSGWRPALSGDKCVRAASVEGKNAARAGAKRHISARRMRRHGVAGVVSP